MRVLRSKSLWAKLVMGVVIEIVEACWDGKRGDAVNKCDLIARVLFTIIGNVFLNTFVYWIWIACDRS